MTGHIHKRGKASWESILPLLPAPTPFPYDRMPAETAAALRKQASRIRERVKTTTRAIIEIGRDLLAVKQNLPGQFGDWVEAECGFSKSAAEDYMRVAKFVEGRNGTVTFLPPAFLYKLSAKSVPPELVKEVIDRVESGVGVSTKELKDALAAAAHQKRQSEKGAERRNRQSKRALAHEESRRRAEARRKEQLQKEEEQLRLKALSIIATVGEKHARFLVQTFFADDGWRVLEHFRREVGNLGADQPPRTNGAEGIAQEMGELAADRWTETH